MFQSFTIGLNRRVAVAIGLTCFAILTGRVMTVEGQCFPYISNYCTVIDFEDYPLNTPITSQYPGVIFSLVPQSCSNAPIVRPIIEDPTGQTCSGSQALTTEQGCPEFSPDYIRMVFDVAQRDVSMCIGEGNYTVRAYSTTSGAGGLLSTQTIAFTSGVIGTVDVLRTVRVTSAATNIRRIEVDAGSDLQEYIDDVSFGVDATPPEAIITYPADEACLCGIVTIQGISCEPDGRLYVDQMHYQKVGTDVWTQIQSDTYEAPVCTNPGTLYTWNTTPADIDHGRYRLRLRSTNLCGCTSTDEVVVWVDKLFEQVTIASPANGQIVGGESVCITGTVYDQCLLNYTAQYRPSSGGAWINIQPGPADPNTVVWNNLLASWDTDAPAPLVADGNYEIRVTGTDTCGNSATDTRFVKVDNTEPVALITAPPTCTPVNGIVTFMGTASDANLASWELHYVGGNAMDWTLIAGGNSNVVNDILADWDTTALPDCCYAVRLRVRDQAVLNCYNGPNECDGSNISDFYITVTLSSDEGGICCDVNGDGRGDAEDVQPFVDCLINGVVGCP